MRFLMYLVAFMALGAAIVAYVAWSSGGEVDRRRVKSAKPKAKKQAVEDDSSYDDASEGGKGGDRERFDDGGNGAGGGAGGGAGADADDSRMYVNQTFEAVLHRKPTDAELAKYSAMGPGNAKIMSAIVRDFPSSAPGAASAGGAAVGATDDVCGADDDDEESCPDDDTGGKNDDSDSDDEHEHKHMPHPSRLPPPEPPKPYSPVHVHRATEAPPDLDWAGRSDRPEGAAKRQRRVCFERSDLLRRIQAIADDVEQFKQYVSML